MSGETAIGNTTLVNTPCHLTSFAAPIAAPIKPPISVCVDDDGSPNHQVARFHTIAPTSAANTITSPWVPSGVEMIPLATVVATFVDTSAPITLSAAAMLKAACGESARVLIETATAFAAS